MSERPFLHGHAHSEQLIYIKLQSLNNLQLMVRYAQIWEEGDILEYEQNKNAFQHCVTPEISRTSCFM